MAFPLRKTPHRSIHTEEKKERNRTPLGDSFKNNLISINTMIAKSRRKTSHFVIVKRGSQMSKSTGAIVEATRSSGASKLAATRPRSCGDVYFT